MHRRPEGNAGRYETAPQGSIVILSTKTGRAFQKRYFARQWDKVFSDAKLTADLHFHDIRGTTVTLLAEAGCSVGEIAAVTGHSVRLAQDIIDKYLARTAYLANAAIDKFEARLAKRV